MQHGWLVNFIHRLTWPRQLARLEAKRAKEEAEKARSIVSVARVLPSYREVDEPRYSLSVDEHITRFQAWTRLGRHELQKLRVVFQIRVDRGDGFKTKMFVSGGLPRGVYRELIPERSLLGFDAAPFKVVESLWVDGMTVVDAEGHATPRGIGYWKGGPQFMQNGDTLKAHIELNAREDGHGLVWGDVFPACEAQDAAQAA